MYSRSAAEPCDRLLEAVAMPIAYVVRRRCSLHGCQTCSTPTHDLQAGVWRWLVVTFSKIRAALLISVR
jgi:hypothetical protein